VGGRLEVGLRGGTKVQVDHVRRRSEVVFPAEVRGVGEEIGGVHYRGILAKGAGRRLKAIAAKLSEPTGTIHVLLENTVPVRVRVVFETAGAGASQAPDVEKDLEPGHHDLKIKRPLVEKPTKGGAAQ